MAEVFRIEGSITGLVSAPRDPEHLYVLFQTGIVARYHKKLNNFDGILIDLSPKIKDLLEAKPKQSKFADERGLLGLIFHPEYNLAGSPFSDTYIVAYSEMADPRFYPDPGFEPDHMTSLIQVTNGKRKYIINIPEPQFNHNGGAMAFDSKNYLYLGTGDGGGQNDEHGPLIDPNDPDSYLGFAQDLQSLLGKILRFELSPDPNIPYKIPQENSFDDLIVQWGFRNPWSFHMTSDGWLFVGDVGQNRFESVKLVDTHSIHVAYGDRIPRSNHGWRAIEGREIFNQSVYEYVTKPGGYTDLGQNIELPIVHYPRDVGIAITGVHFKNDRLLIVDYKGTIIEAKPDWENLRRPWEYQIIKKINHMIHRLGVDQNDDDRLYVLAYDSKKKQSIIYSLEKLLADEKEKETLREDDIKRIIQQGIETAKQTKSGLRENGSPVKMHFSIVKKGEEEAKLIHSMPDAWAGSVDISKRKAYTAMAFSSNENALTTRTIGILSQPRMPLWQIGNSNPIGGIIEFPGGLPLYKNGQLVGGLGVSGDGVDQDEIVAIGAAKGFEPPSSIRSDITAGFAYTI